MNMTAGNLFENMKRAIYILSAIASVAILTQSCDKWLEASSSSQVSDTKMFSTRNGFHEAVSGVYIAMGSSDCYGRNYTFFINELVGVNYSPINIITFQDWQNHTYTSSTAMAYINSMWQSGYYIIANANKILVELDKRRNVITDDTEYDLIKGEMLAARAYVHFDLLKMFGLSSWTGENAGKKTIPYVTSYTSETTPQRTYAQTLELLQKDIDDALVCLEQDPVTGNAPENFNDNVNTDGFWDNRTRHLNYYAVKALAARVALWSEDYGNAAEYAQEVIDNALDKQQAVEWIDADEQVKYSSNDSRDWTFSCEHLFSLEVTDLYSLTSSYCFGGTSQYMYLQQDDVESALFIRNDGEDGYDGAEDIRGYALLLKYGGSGYSSFKFYSSSSAAYKNRIPMIRISEMYYILALKAYIDNDYTAMQNHLFAVMKHRGYTSELIPESLSKSWAQVALTNEITREFIGEGQLFYWDKIFCRLDIFSMLSMPLNREDATLIYPYPTSETSYGHIQEK